jgi:DivIVA domain-containing protein
VDRDAITRRDFPTGRRGYDAAAVDEHLRRVADEVEALRERQAAPPAARPTLAEGASEQVRAILAAAEQGAGELRAKAGREAGEHVARAEQAAGALLLRLGEVERELGGLLEALRAGAERLTGGLSALHDQAEALRAAAAPLEPATGLPPEPLEEDYAAAAPAHVDGEDEAGARLAALNLALGGAPREETAAYLAEHFGLAEPDALLDDVYARVDG